ncbi:uncharacterized protein DUF4845 [Crenobacter luteus]|uniref:DUF4845 domain-containing protein n=1 Tax=Crenobacter luteus TaxID=1452487 RepID=A0A163B9M7_9NEIS|nr:DUF4845 domain-containing protein [Crenobacter luteus]KZE25300.1 hypothetical protein AVW16_03075 [Crenobacter luteus]TCP11561.1 uncharacterized protein DUF4845 [Crenobacter luteus]
MVIRTFPAGLDRQAGMGSLAVIALVALFGLALLAAFRVVPVYTEYAEVKSAVAEAAKDPARSESEARRIFRARAVVAGIGSVKDSDLIVVAGGNFLTVRARYRREVPLVANVKLAFDFDTQAGQGPAAQQR